MCLLATFPGAILEQLSISQQPPWISENRAFESDACRCAHLNELFFKRFDQ